MQKVNVLVVCGIAAEEIAFLIQLLNSSKCYFLSMMSDTIVVVVVTRCQKLSDKSSVL